MRTPFQVIRWMLLACLLAGVSSFGADSIPVPAGSTCAVCGKVLEGKVYYIPKAGFFCKECSDLPTRCTICGLPAKDNFVKTDDGRIICQREAAKALLKKEEAVAMFEATRRHILQMTGGAMGLVQSNIVTTMFDSDYWNYREGKPLPPTLRRMGFSGSRKTDQWTHNVVLLSGQLKDEVPTVCAHEYTHLWINENRPAERTIEFETLEAICELVAYKFAETTGDEAAKAKVRENVYTSGRIETLIAAEARFGLNTILEWVRSGKELTVSDGELAQVKVPSTMAARMAPAENPVFGFTRTAPAPLEAKLQLRGLLGSGAKRLALINGTPFAKGEEARLKLETGMVKVRCVDILERAVIVTVDGGDKQTLDLEGQ